MNTKSKPTSKEAKLAEMGLRLKAIRTELRMTLADMSKDCGLSRSYISDFERGFRLPTSRYMRYLHDHRSVNLNYIFSGNGWMFRTPPKGVPPDFGRFQEEVLELLNLMAEIPPALYSVIAFFSEYRLRSKDIIEMYRAQKKAEAGE